MTQCNASCKEFTYISQHKPANSTSSRYNELHLYHISHKDNDNEYFLHLCFSSSLAHWQLFFFFASFVFGMSFDLLRDNKKKCHIPNQSNSNRIITLGVKSGVFKNYFFCVSFFFFEEEEEFLFVSYKLQDWAVDGFNMKTIRI